MALRLDTTPLRTNKDFQNLWLSGIITGLGSFATYVAMPFQVAQITGSYVAVGVLGLIEVVPLVVFGLWGGVIADRFDRRSVVAFTEVALLVLAGTLLVNAQLAHPHVWLIYSVSGLFAATDGIQRPSLDALMPRIVSPEELPAASALRSLRGNIAHIVGPGLGGVLISVGGVSLAYLFDVASFAASVYFLLRISRIPSLRDSRNKPVTELKEAFNYLQTRRDIIGTYVVDTIAMVCAFPFALFPFIAQKYDAPWALGFLYSTLAFGSLLATVTSGWSRRVIHHGRAVVLAAIGWGSAICCAGLFRNIWWVLACLLLAGFADMLSGLFRSLIWDLTIPDELRGRMAGLELLSYAVGPRLGDVRSTLTARFSTVGASLAIGGALCVGTTSSVKFVLPELWNFSMIKESE